MEKRIKFQYGTFAFAAGVYVAGVLLVSIWSYASHRSELLSSVDQSLLNAAFSNREVNRQTVLECMKTHNGEEQNCEPKLEKSLQRLARHGRFSGIGAALIHDGHTDLVLARPLQQPAELDLAQPDLQNRLKQALLDRSYEGDDDALIFTLKSRTSGYIRVGAIIDTEQPGEGSAYVAVLHSSIIQKELTNQMLRFAAVGLTVLVLAIPLILLYSRAQKDMSRSLSYANEQLQRDNAEQKTREKELKEAIGELERFSAVTTGRELRIIELKSEVNTLLEELNRAKRYNIDKID